ncbi:MAG TPA: fumarate/nitrate reduction transcriptional regulator Fnr [Casimicrobiaceae bacterium]|nr:fumarate/nitrate reduction transcriptional regulator Fnr [Casimicrobiaceae bacterium]
MWKPDKELSHTMPPPVVVSMRELRGHCLHCAVRDLCLPVGIDQDGLRQLDAAVAERVRLEKGDTAYRAGDRFTALHAIRVGSCKTTVLGEKGHEQVAGFHITGDIIGMDGIGSGRHGGDAVALEDTELCVLPFDRVEELARQITPLQRNLHRIMSREIERDENVMLLLGSMRAEERLAVFLLNLSHRYRARGYSETEFVLRLTREDIGSFLGLKLETVSRSLSRFQAAGLLQVQGRVVKLLDLTALKQLAGHRCA